MCEKVFFILIISPLEREELRGKFGGLIESLRRACSKFSKIDFFTEKEIFIAFPYFIFKEKSKIKVPNYCIKFNLKPKKSTKKVVYTSAPKVLQAPEVFAYYGDCPMQRFFFIMSGKRVFYFFFFPILPKRSNEISQKKINSLRQEIAQI